MDRHAHSGHQQSAGDRRRATPSGERESVEAGSAPNGFGPSRLDRISQRAFAIYQARGGEHGRSLDDWLEAERQIDAEQQ